MANQQLGSRLFKLLKSKNNLSTFSFNLKSEGSFLSLIEAANGSRIENYRSFTNQSKFRISSLMSIERKFVSQLNENIGDNS